MEEASHLMVVSPDRKRKAAFDRRIFRLIIRVFQRAACEKRLLTLVECYSTKLLPIIDK
jgi:hypothetical protein